MQEKKLLEMENVRNTFYNIESKYKEKSLHGQLLRHADEYWDDSSRDWFKRKMLKKETEGIILMAEPDRTLITNAIKLCVNGVLNNQIL